RGHSPVVGGHREEFTTPYAGPPMPRNTFFPGPIFRRCRRPRVSRRATGALRHADTPANFGITGLLLLCAVSTAFSRVSPTAAPAISTPTVHAITFSGNTTYPPQTLSRSVSLKINGQFDPNQLQYSVSALAGFYR